MNERWKWIVTIGLVWYGICIMVFRMSTFSFGWLLVFRMSRYSHDWVQRSACSYCSKYAAVKQLPENFKSSARCGPWSKIILTLEPCLDIWYAPCINCTKSNSNFWKIVNPPSIYCILNHCLRFCDSCFMFSKYIFSQLDLLVWICHISLVLESCL